MELRRWPRKNDPDSIRARQDELSPRLDGAREVFGHDLEPFSRATEALTGVSVVPVAVVGPIDVSLADARTAWLDGLGHALFGDGPDA